MSRNRLIASLLSLACIGAHAASADLAVDATITPEACSLTLGNGGKADYGDLSVKTVRGYRDWSGAYRHLPNKSIPLEVNCGSATRFVLSLIDNRSSSIPTTVADRDQKYGLGQATGASGSKGIGFFEVRTDTFRSAFADGSSYDSGLGIVRGQFGGWQWLNATEFYVKSSKEFAYAGRDGLVQPGQFLRLWGQLVVMAKVSTDALDAATSIIRIDGSVTVLLQYV